MHKSSTNTLFKTILRASKYSKYTPCQFSKYSTSSSINTLVLLEHDNKTINSASLAAISAAQKIGGQISALLFTTSADSSVVQQASKIKGIQKLIHCSNPKFDHGIAETLEPALLRAIEQVKCTHFFAPHTAFGKNVVPRLAGGLDVSPISDIISVINEKQFVRLIYAGNAVSQVESNDKIKLITVRATAFDKAAITNDAVQVETLASPDIPADTPQWLSEQLTKSDRPELSNASRIVSGGRALKSAENFKIMYDLADVLGAAVGATRAAVDAGYAPNDLQIGQTGKVVAPELYIAAGISGAIQHLAGMKDSKCIVAINKDPEAPIFQVADYGIVGDLFKIVPEMTQALKK